MARVHLKYHTWAQVIGGIAYALIYTVIFNMYVWDYLGFGKKYKNMKKLRIFMLFSELNSMTIIKKEKALQKNNDLLFKLYINFMIIIFIQ